MRRPVGRWPISGFAVPTIPTWRPAAAFIGGCASTSFVAGARVFDLPTGGTIPHALVQVFATEEEAFRAVAENLDHYSLLLDTYDVHTAIETAVAVALDTRARLGHEMVAVRLDSGDLLADSKHVRRVLDEAGLHETKVLVSGDIDEFRIADLLQAGAPIAGFGVGGNLAVGLGTVASGTVGGVLGAVYKLVWYEGVGDPARIKLAGEKSTWPGRKLVYRIGDSRRTSSSSTTSRRRGDGTPLLQPAIRDGEIVADLPPIPEIQARAMANVQALPQRYRTLHDPAALSRAAEPPVAPIAGAHQPVRTTARYQPIADQPIAVRLHVAEPSTRPSRHRRHGHRQRRRRHPGPRAAGAGGGGAAHRGDDGLRRYLAAGQDDAPRPRPDGSH